VVPPTAGTPPVLDEVLGFFVRPTTPLTECLGSVGLKPSAKALTTSELVPGNPIEGAGVEEVYVALLGSEWVP